MRMSMFLAVSLALTFFSGGDGIAQGDDERRASTVSFEEAAAGAFEKLETPLGTWSANVGRAIVDNKHAKTGRHCLQLTGGEQTTATLDLADGVDTAGELRFWAERWTKRTPFSFRIEKNGGDGWKEIFNGDKEIRVGRAFLSYVKVPLLDAEIRQLRFTCSSPPNTGILIDDIRIAPARPQKVQSVDVVPFTLPVLVGRESSPLARLKIETEGTLKPVSTTALKFMIEGEDKIDALRLVRNDSTIASRLPLAAVAGQSVVTWKFSPIELSDGSNSIEIHCELKPGADIDDQIGLAISEVTLSNGQAYKLQSPVVMQRLGVAVRNGGDDDVHTYRIPGLATTNAGTLIGVYDVRRRNGGDLPGDIDVGMSRATDGGQTWEPMRVIMDMGDDPQWNYDGIGDPAVLVDRNTGTIWVAGTWSHGNRSWRGSGPGLEPEETGQFMLVRSDDDGVTWSKPINITKQVKKPEWCFILQGPGKGITMRDGTIVFAAQYQDPPDQKRLPHSTIIYSKDHGETWHAGTGAFDDTTESQVVEVEPGVLMLNCRYNRKSARVVMTTRDMGRTWQKHPTSERSLIEPRACMASLINVDQELGKDAGGWLLFSNPDSLVARQRMMIKASSDGGLTWPKQHRLLLDENRSAGYSCMTMIDEQTVGILYEGSQAHMTFQRIPLNDILGKPDVSTAEVDGRNSGRISLPDVFSDHMVLQADAEIPVWGRGPVGADIAVTFGKETQRTTVSTSGDWQVRLSPRKANAKPAALLVQSGDQRVELKDVLVGEVWVCAGQSNMEWPLSQSANAQTELAEADHPQLRLLHLVGGARGSSGSYTSEHLARLTPQTFCEAQWQVASAESAREFSAVGWYFGRHLQQSLKVPVGLICPAVGGTPTEAWIPREALAADSELKGLVAGNWLDNELLGDFCRARGEQNLLAALQAGEELPGDGLGPNHAFKPGFMWDAGVQPLLPYAIRGVIWYQGESNAETAKRIRQHQRLFPLLVNEWRKRWGQGDFPFLQVQLPAMNRPEWPAFRESQRRMTERLINVGMAITIDTGHPSNVHPPLKQPVGQRLAEWALGTTYDQRNTAYSGPLVDAVKREADAIEVEFRQTGDGLKRSDNQPLRHFEVAGADGIFYPASAKITGPNTVSVSRTRVTTPQHVRYACKPFPSPPVNLVNSRNLPASPFSTEPDLPGTSTSAQDAAVSDQRDSRLNILLIVGEDHGCELSCYGDPVINTPHIDRLASQGVLFENGYVTQSVCSPSRSTIFTGLFPHQNGQLGLATHQYGWFRKWPTTYSLLKKAGYRTGLIGKTHVIPADAVESFVDFRFQPSSNFAKRKVADYAVKAGEFFRAGNSPFFMTVNYPDAHWPLQGQVDGLPESRVDPDRVKVMPYIGHETPRMREVVLNYYDCMLRLDACVGQLLKQLDDSGKADNTLVVFIGDHGAQMARGKVTVYEGGMRVPYIVRWPGVTKAGHRSKALVSTTDLLPTFMDAAERGTDDWLQHLPGKSLRPALTGTADVDFREYLACERNCDAARHTFPQRTIRDARFKLIHSSVRDREDPAARYYREHGASHWSGCLTDQELKDASERTRAGYARWLNPPEYQLYDLHSDPHEWDDLATDPEFSEVRQRLQAALERWQTETHDPIADPSKLQQLVDENDAVFKAGRRSPKDGWRYLEYLAPTAAPWTAALAP